MKKLLLIAAMVVGAVSSASAELQRVVNVQVADNLALGVAAGKVGAMIGNPMASAGIAAAIAELPTMKYFGPMPLGSSMMIAVYADVEKLVKLEDGECPADEDTSFDVLYPMVDSKDQFLKRHANAKEADGIVVVKEKGKTFYTAFSADGKWATLSESAKGAARALKGVDKIKPIKNDIVRVKMTAPCLKAVTSALEKDPESADAVELLKMCESFGFALRVTDAAIDFVFSVKPVEGTDCAKLYKKPVKDPTLAFADESAVFAVAYAEGAGSKPGDDGMEDAKKVYEAFKKCGLDITKFMSLEKKADFINVVIDAEAIAKMVSEESDLGDINIEELGKVCDELGLDDNKIHTDGPAIAAQLSVKGFKSQWKPSERLAAMVPELTTSQPAVVCFFSLSSMASICGKYALATMPDDQRAVMAIAMAEAFKEQKGGCAMLVNHKDGQHRVLFRVSADEVKSMGGIFSSMMMMGLSNAMTNMPLPEEAFEAVNEDDESDED